MHFFFYLLKKNYILRPLYSIYTCLFPKVKVHFQKAHHRHHLAKVSHIKENSQSLQTRAQNRSEMGSATAEERNIVVAVDEGEESLYALSWCLDNMVSSGSDRSLTLLHVKRPAVIYPTIDRTDTINFHDAISSLDWRDQQIGRWAMEKAMKLCQGHKVKVEAKLEEGDPSDVICRMVDELKPDFLVMGSHGYGPINRKVRGSVSTDCVQRANCPVIVVKKPKRNA